MQVEKKTWQEVREQYGCGMMQAKQIVSTCSGFAHIIAFYAPLKGQAVVRKPSLEDEVVAMVKEAQRDLDVSRRARNRFGYCDDCKCRRAKSHYIRWGGKGCNIQLTERRTK